MDSIVLAAGAGGSCLHAVLSSLSSTDWSRIIIVFRTLSKLFRIIETSKNILVCVASFYQAIVKCLITHYEATLSCPCHECPYLFKFNNFVFGWQSLIVLISRQDKLAHISAAAAETVEM